MTDRLVVLLVGLLGAAPAWSSPAEDPIVSVEETAGGGYVVTARFAVPEASSVAWEVLTDYANIPRFMPDVRTSRILERSEGYALVEQEAVSKFLFFSKAVHLVLHVDEEPGVIRFRDRCNRSFEEYEGEWSIADLDGRTEITYALRAQPAFSVPEFLLRRLLNRDAREMVERLRGEIGSRATAR